MVGRRAAHSGRLALAGDKPQRYMFLFRLQAAAGIALVADVAGACRHDYHTRRVWNPT